MNTEWELYFDLYRIYIQGYTRLGGTVIYCKKRPSFQSGNSLGYVAVTGRKRRVISLECFIEITPDFLCPFMNA